ncbi:MAG: hypothetical protein P4L22_01615 [Candidatus Babeliales bacterium]|nr:hypothetical protein [Candidatus Babeliales bacterium]
MMKNNSIFLLLVIGLISNSQFIYGKKCFNNVNPPRPQPITLTYYLNVSDFARSFIAIPTSNVSTKSLTLASSYLAGRAPIYNSANKKAGTCSASFLNMKTKDGIFTDISNYISAENGLIVTWFTPTKLANLELDSIIHGMVTECLVTVTTKVGFSLFYGQKFNLVVSSKDGRIYFQFTSI